MNDPYEVLGVKPGASDAEIKAAYKALVKKYHPDKYQNNPLAGLAEEKLQEINEAYDRIVKSRNASSSYEGGACRRPGYDRGGFSGYDPSGYGYKSSADGYAKTSPAYQKVRNALDRNDLAEAEQLLVNISGRDAEWFFLSGVLSYKKGWIDDALANVREAMSMDPGNGEYARVYQQMAAGSRMYAYRSDGQGYDVQNGPCPGCGTLYFCTPWWFCFPC